MFRKITKNMGFFTILLIFLLVTTMLWTGTVQNDGTAVGENVDVAFQEIVVSPISVRKIKSKANNERGNFYRHVVRMDDDLTYVNRSGLFYPSLQVKE